MHASHIFRYANEYLDKKISVYHITLGPKLAEIEFEICWAGFQMYNFNLNYIKLLLI